MPETGLEPARREAYAPKAYVYTNFTTGAYGYYNIFFHFGEKNLKIIPITMGAIFWSSFPLDLILEIPLHSMGYGFWKSSSPTN